MSKKPQAPQTQEPEFRGQGQTTLLTDPHRINDDLRLIERSVRKRWGMAPEERELIKQRLLQVVAKEFVTRLDKQGERVADDDKADTNAITAARVLVMIEGQDQSDEHKALDKQKPDLHAHLHGTAGQLAAPHESDPAYIEYLRTRALSSDGNTGIVRTDS